MALVSRIFAARPPGGPPWRRLRTAIALLVSLALVGLYYSLPGGDDSLPLEPDLAPPMAESAALRKVEILEIAPSDAHPGDAVTITLGGDSPGETPRVFAGKEDMTMLSRRPGVVVARLPADLAPGRAKIRVAFGAERSKPYDLRIKLANRRKPVRNLIGGFALLIFGLGLFSRGVSGAVGLGSAHTLSRMARRGPAAFGLGAAAGALTQSTTAAAGLLSGLVSSSLLAVAPAAAAFLGAQLGAATAPLLMGIVDAREGLVVVAIGVLWLELARDRRSSAVARIVLGTGFIAFGLHVLRTAFEPLVSDPALLPFIATFTADAPARVIACALLGAALVAVLQGPAPVLVLVVGLVQTTGQWDLRTALAVLSGAGLGAAVGALLTTPRGPRGRRLMWSHLALGTASTILLAATVPVWVALADHLVPGAPDNVAWGKRVLLPHFAWHLGVAFGLSQLTAAVLFVPLCRPLERLLTRRFPDHPAPQADGTIGDVVSVVRARLLTIVERQRTSLSSLFELVIDGNRTAGRRAEHLQSQARGLLEELLGGPVRALPRNETGKRTGRLAFTALQLERALEAVLRQAENLTERRIAIAPEPTNDAPRPRLYTADEAVLRDMQTLLDESLGALTACLGDRGGAVDVEAARDREIRMNGFEARARALLLAHDGPDEAGAAQELFRPEQLDVLKLVDAYEAAGNHVYRLFEALAEAQAHGDERAATA